MNVASITFPASLPVSAARHDIEAAVCANQVVIVCGETGSGKTTQLPKMLLSMGLAQHGRIAHTQPRRLAAVTTAQRIAQELGPTLGKTVGHTIRFDDRTSPDTLIHVMTDGILLAKTLKDRDLRDYSCIIIDEAHERSLNIDFLLGYLHQLRHRRPDLKLIITSATLDTTRFAEHFADAHGQPAPVLTIPGQLFPVSIRYCPQAESAESTPLFEDPMEQAMHDAIQQCVAHGPGDMLAFLPGERQIQDLQRALTPHWPELDILPLYARLPNNQQQRIFKPSSNRRRLILSTNVAETSVTVPGIHFVIDSGQARIKRYSYRNKVEQLRIEGISQASAQQRAGRCGRLGPGLCIRLYEEADLLGRPTQTDPELLRSSLAAVLLRMLYVKLGDIRQFPFLEPPSGRAIQDGWQLLEELHALEPQPGAMRASNQAGQNEAGHTAADQHHAESGQGRRLSKIGLTLAKLPLDPRIGRMLLAARSLGCEQEMLWIVTGLTIEPIQPDWIIPREQRAVSDFMQLWHFAELVQTTLAENGSRSAQDKRWQEAGLIPRRVREWLELVQQVERLLTESRQEKKNAHDANHRGSSTSTTTPVTITTPTTTPIKAEPSPQLASLVHQALLTGLLGNIGFFNEPVGAGRNQGLPYQGARGIRFAIHPRSMLARQSPRWLMCGELIETSKLYGHDVAPIEPAWLERIGAHLIKTSIGEPHWEKKAAQVVVYERATLYGLTVYQQRRKDYGRFDLRHARELFIRHALVAGEWQTSCEFIVHNRRMVEQWSSLSHRTRRLSTEVDDEWLFSFYDERLPSDICRGDDAERWDREQLRLDAESHRQRMMLTEEHRQQQTSGSSGWMDRYPKSMHWRGSVWSLSYHFEPGSVRDGLTMQVPLALLNQVDPLRCEWLVPGMLKDKVHALLKSLPPRLRRHCVPLPAMADGFVEQWLPMLAGDSPAQGAGSASSLPNLLTALIEHIAEHAGVRPALQDFRLEMLPQHCLMNVKLTDDQGRQLDMSRSLPALRANWGGKARELFTQIMQPGLARLAQAQTASDQEISLSSKDTSVEQAGMSTSASDLAIQRWDDQQRYTGWTFGDLPEVVDQSCQTASGMQRLVGFPALQDAGDAVRLVLYDDTEQAETVHQQGLMRLFKLALKESLRSLEKKLPDFQRCAMLFLPLGDAELLKAQWLDLAIQQSAMVRPWPTTAAAFDQRVAEARPRLSLIAQELGRLIAQTLDGWSEAQRSLKALHAQFKTQRQSLDDIATQLAFLLPKEWLRQFDYPRLREIPRYLRSINVRLERLRQDPLRDLQALQQMKPLEQRWMKLHQARRGQRDPSVENFGWLLQEWRVSLFSQGIKTPMPVSLKRLEQAWRDMGLAG